jgi:hypothetical protein
MKLISFKQGGAAKAGLWLGDGKALDLSKAGAKSDVSSVLAILKGGEAATAPKPAAEAPAPKPPAPPRPGVVTGDRKRPGAGEAPPVTRAGGEGGRGGGAAAAPAPRLGEASRL